MKWACSLTFYINLGVHVHGVGGLAIVQQAVQYIFRGRLKVSIINMGGI